MESFEKLGQIAIGQPYSMVEVAWKDQHDSTKLCSKRIVIYGPTTDICQIIDMSPYHNQVALNLRNKKIRVYEAPSIGFEQISKRKPIDSIKSGSAKIIKTIKEGLLVWSDKFMFTYDTT